MSTLATGGMANYDSSFASFAPLLWIGTVFMLIGSLTFIRYVQVARGDPGALLRDSQIRTFLAIYLAFALGLLVARRSIGDASARPRCARPRSTSPRSSRRPDSPRPTTASGARRRT